MLTTWKRDTQMLERVQRKIALLQGLSKIRAQRSSSTGLSSGVDPRRTVKSETNCQPIDAVAPYRQPKGWIADSAETGSNSLPPPHPHYRHCALPYVPGKPAVDVPVSDPAISASCQVFIPHGQVEPWFTTEVAALRFRNSQHTAILRIPSEILVSIFRQVIKTSPDYQEAVQLITSICYYLRKLVFGTPELWGFVNLSGYLGPLFLERCQYNPISVVPYFWESDAVRTERVYNCLNYWKNTPNLHLTRVELIEFSGTSENFAAVSWIFNYHLPNLETLTLASGQLMETLLSLEEPVEVWSVNPSTQCTLKDVHLQQIFVPWGSKIFHGLSTLYLDYRGFLASAISIPMAPFLEVLSHSPRLEKCSLYSAIPHCYSEESLQDTRPTWTLNFPLLEELTLFDDTLNVAYLLRYLHFPTTTKTLLKLDMSPDQLYGLLSTLFPPNSPMIDLTTRIALQHNPAREFRPALEVGHTTIQYLNDWDGILIGPDDVTHTTFTTPLVEAVHRVGLQVRFLKIRLDCGLVVRGEVWKDLLEHLPILEELVYIPGEEGVYQWPAFWTALSQTGERGLICPSLRKLRIVNPQGVPPDSVRCLSARWKLDRPLEVFHLRVENCERSFAYQTIPYLSPFVGQLIFEVIEERQIVSLTD